MSSDVKQLIVVAEGTAALGPYWQTIVSDYLEKITRSFCGSELNGETNAVSSVELSLVIFNTHGSYCACLVQRSGWTRDVDTFLHWLSSIQFDGGGFNGVATAEGLAEALMMFSPTSGQAQPSKDLKRHCILITASNPHIIPTPVYRPRLQNVKRKENGNAQSESRISDAETIASYFAKCCVSLSVVCPRQLPKIRALYDAGKRNSQSPDMSLDTVKNPFYLVLISEDFVEARATLSKSTTNLPQTQSSVNMDIASVAPSLPVTGQPPAPVTSANGAIPNRQPVSVTPVPTATVKVEPSTVSFMAPVPSFPHLPSVARPATQANPAIKTSSGSSVSQDMVIKAENAPDIKPVVVGGMITPLRAGPSGRASVNVRNDLSQVRQVVSSAAPSSATSSVGQRPVAMDKSNMRSTGIATSLPPSQAGFSSGQQGITSVAGSGAQTGQSLGTNNAFRPQTTSNVASNLGVSQPMQGMNQGSHSGAQIMQSRPSMNRNIMSGLGQGNVSSGTSGMMPSPGVGQQAQNRLQLGGNNSSAPNVQLSQPSSGAVQTSQPRYIRCWEGNLNVQRKQGEIVHISKLEGYRPASASDSLAANWPETMVATKIAAAHHLDKQSVSRAVLFVFRVMTPHSLFRQLQDRNVCAVIDLPSQTLVLTGSDKPCRLIGMVFPADVVVFRQQLQQQQQQMSLSQRQQQASSLSQRQQQASSLSQMQQQSSTLSQRHQQSSQLSQRQQQSSPLNQMQQQRSVLSQRQQQASPLSQMEQQRSPLNQMQQQSSPLSQMQQQTSPMNQMQQQSSAVMGGQAFGQGRRRSQQGGAGQSNMPGAGGFIG